MTTGSKKCYKYSAFNTIHSRSQPKKRLNLLDFLPQVWLTSDEQMEGSAHRFTDSKPDRKPKSTAQIGGGIDQPEIRLRIYYNSGEVSLSLKDTRKTALKMKHRTRTEDLKSPGKSSISPDVGSGSRGSINQYSSSVYSERSNHADKSCDLLEIIEGKSVDAGRKTPLKTKYRTRTEDRSSDSKGQYSSSAYSDRSNHTDKSYDPLEITVKCEQKAAANLPPLPPPYVGGIEQNQRPYSNGEIDVNTAKAYDHGCDQPSIDVRSKISISEDSDWEDVKMPLETT
ncbi:hypothetical protein V8E54_000900 [Elaphomyces granulatus]